MRFEGTAAYVADKDLMVAVNAAIALERPLLVKGEPGTGKTELALSRGCATASLGMPDSTTSKTTSSAASSGTPSRPARRSCC